MQFYPLKLYFKHLPNLIILPLSLLTNIITWLWLIKDIKSQAEPIFLHYNALFGVDYIGEWWRLFYIPLTGLTILVVNAILGWIFFSKDKFIAQILNAISLVCQIFLLVAVGVLIFLNV